VRSIDAPDSPFDNITINIGTSRWLRNPAIDWWDSRASVQAEIIRSSSGRIPVWIEVAVSVATSCCIVKHAPYFRTIVPKERPSCDV